MGKDIKKLTDKLKTTTPPRDYTLAVSDESQGKERWAADDLYKTAPADERPDPAAPVDPTPYVPRGHGRETTFQQNLTDPAEVDREAERLARRVLEDVRAEGRPAVRVGVKLRYAPFVTTTRSLTLAGPTLEEEPVVAAVHELLGRLDRGARPTVMRMEGELGPEEHGLVITHYGTQVVVEATEGENAGQHKRCHFRSNLGSVVTGDRVVWREYLETVARTQFGLVRPGETAVVVDGPVRPRPERTAGQRWWEALFAR